MAKLSLPVPDTAPAPVPSLKDWFDEARFRHIATELSAVHRRFDSEAFLRHSLPGIDALTLMQRLRRMTESLRTTLPPDYRKSLEVLRELAPRINHNFVTLVLPDFVGLYGHDDFEVSMEALKDFTLFGSSEFAVREFLRRDLARTLKVMEKWSRHEHEAVRRLASEGTRPRLPWSFRLEALIADPSPVLPILENLNEDPSLYVRKSVANHLNDITKDHPEWVMDRLGAWPIEQPHTAWIAKRALRTLIKKGNPRALGLIRAGERPKVRIREFTVIPPQIGLGDRVSLSLTVESQSTKAQRLVVDYIVHYVKKSGGVSEKVFKWKELDLPPGATVSLTRSQQIKDFTTRVHHAGRHDIEVALNGERMARGFFVLSRQQ